MKHGKLSELSAPGDEGGRLTLFPRSASLKRTLLSRDWSVVLETGKVKTAAMRTKFGALVDRLTNAIRVKFRFAVRAELVVGATA